MRRNLFVIVIHLHEYTAYADPSQSGCGQKILKIDLTYSSQKPVYHMAEVKDYFTGAVTLDRQEFGKLFANSIHLHDYTAYCRATRPQRIHCIRWGYLNGLSGIHGWYSTLFKRSTSSDII